MNLAAVRVVFMGSPEFAVPSLRQLVEEGYNVVAAVSQPDRPAGRGGRLQLPPVKVAAQSLGIEAFQPDSLRDATVQERLAAFDADVFVVAAYGKILPKKVLAMPRRGSINVHASLLPRWRGPSPIVASILAGDRETGVSIMELSPGMDEGPVISRVALPISDEATASGLEPRLAQLGAEELVRVLPAWFEGHLQPGPQEPALVTYCSLIKKADGHLRAAMTVDEAERAVRAYNPWPGAYVTYRGERLAIWGARIERLEDAATAGQLSVRSRKPAIRFSSGWLVLDEVQRQGSRRASGTEFLNGERGLLPETVGLA